MKHIAKILLSVSILGFSQTAVAEDSRLDSMISPVTNPVNFEDPRATTEIRPLYMYHKLHPDFVTGAGDVQLWAAQVRIALNDRLTFIATKDGYVQINSDRNLSDSEGAANLAAGFKYAFHKDDAVGEIATAGFRYEVATGDPDVFQGNGDGIFNVFLSGAKALDDINVAGYTGLRIGTDGDTSFFDASFHADMPMGNFYPLFEANLVTVIDEGDRIGLDGEGFDVLNFGSSEANGSVVTVAAGARYRICDKVDFGVAYEVAVTDRKDVFDWRITSDFIIKPFG